MTEEMDNKLDLTLDELIAKNEDIIKDKNKDLLKKRKLSEGSELSNKRRESEVTVELVTNSETSDESVDELVADFGHIFVSNLKYRVTDNDIYALFQAFGPLVRAAVNYNINGRSEGTAFVVFERKSDAKKSFDAINGQPLDGRNVRLRLIEDLAPIGQSVGELSSRIKSFAPKTSSVDAKRQVWTEMAKNYDSINGLRSEDRNYRRRGSYGHSGNNLDSTRVEVTVEELDEELDSYASETKLMKK